MGQMSICIRTQWTCLLAGSVFGSALVITNAVLQPSRGVPLLPSAEQKVSAPPDAEESPVDSEIRDLCTVRFSAAEISMRESVC